MAEQNKVDNTVIIVLWRVYEIVFLSPKLANLKSAYLEGVSGWSVFPSLFLSPKVAKSQISIYFKGEEGVDSFKTVTISNHHIFDWVGGGRQVFTARVRSTTGR